MDRLTQQDPVHFHIHYGPLLKCSHSRSPPACQLRFPLLPVCHRLRQRNIKSGSQFFRGFIVARIMVQRYKLDLVTTSSTRKAVKSLSVRIYFKARILILMEGALTQPLPIKLQAIILRHLLHGDRFLYLPEQIRIITFHYH